MPVNHGEVGDGDVGCGGEKGERSASGLSGPMASNTIAIWIENAIAWNRNSPKTACAKVKLVWGKMTRLSVNRQPRMPLAK